MRYSLESTAVQWVWDSQQALSKLLDRIQAEANTLDVLAARGLLQLG
jgi:hypothetical protein